MTNPPHTGLTVEQITDYQKWLTSAMISGHSGEWISKLAMMAIDSINLTAENARLKAIVKQYTILYPAFRIRMVGAENSPARKEQIVQIALEDDARAALTSQKPSPPMVTPSTNTEETS